jgi:hypothetical protein
MRGGRSARAAGVQAWNEPQTRAPLAGLAAECGHENLAHHPHGEHLVLLIHETELACCRFDGHRA